jgi:hypothetical protein
MQWLAFSYSLNAQAASTPRVTLWRRLKRLGAIAPTGSVYLLPAQDETWEAFQWLAQEIRSAGGEALVMRVEGFEELDEASVIALFNAVRAEEYAELETRLAAWEARSAEDKPDDLKTDLDRLQKQHAEIARADYFHAPEGIRLAERLNRAGRRLQPAEPEPEIPPADPEGYHGRTWVTRPRPFVDRLASAWLIRRFIDPEARIRYDRRPRSGEVSFDTPDAVFGHSGSRCTFETLLRAFGVTEPGLFSLAEIVHEVDLRDGRYSRPEAAGLEAVLRGWHAAGLTDAELEANGLVLFDGLYAALSSSV